MGVVPRRIYYRLQCQRRDRSVEENHSRQVVREG